ncbi:transcriptional regulator [Mariniflexile ostreae]|uniref:Transcriptional regulator n=1 Tax=Mariniflexile ostreae TaxID=1520892 RepID=A0ABV5FCV1_9FLAO
MMRNRDNIREKILNQPSYWVEGINSFLYNAILEYMEDNNMNRTELASHLGISKGRVSQILNDGEINFSIEKVVQIALKINKFPIFELKDKNSYFNDLNSTNHKTKDLSFYENDSFSEVYSKNKKDSKIIPLYSNNEFKKQLAL